MGDHPLNLGKPTSGELAYVNEQRMTSSNTLSMAVLGPVFGLPGMLGRAVGLDERWVGVLNETVGLGIQMAGATKLLRRGSGRALAVANTGTLPPFGSLVPTVRVARPKWRTSEIDLEHLYGPHGYDAQASFLKGTRVQNGTAGSTRPDVYKTGESIDIKNYNLQSASGRNNLVRDVSKQAFSRAQNLPAGDLQKIVLDVRGQNVSTLTLNRLAIKIQIRSSGTIQASNIAFWR